MEKFLSVNIHDVVRLCEIDYYDFIIVGSGMGGGVLARTILDPEPPHDRKSPDNEEPSNNEESSDDKKPPSHPRVLLIERGSSLFSTHVLNTPSPRWNPDDPKGPSMDNALVYDIVKSPVSTVTSKSLPYVGGPVHCLGGRSNLWGLYTPRMHKEEVKKYFPQEVLDYLFPTETGDTEDTGYSRAYKFLCGDSKASISKPYPDDGSIHADTVNHANLIRESFGKIDLRPSVSIGPFSYCPMAAEFTHRNPQDKMYHMSMGGFSTVNWILDRIYNKDEHLHVLTTSKVVAVESAAKSDTKGDGKTGSQDQKVVGLTIPDDFNRNITIPVREAQVILSAGTIDTATIALRSGLGRKLPRVGVGLTDHEIWGTRLEYVIPEDGFRQALRLQSWVSLYHTDSDPASADTSQQSRCLLNVTINAQSFLGWAHEKRLPTRYIDEYGLNTDREKFEEINKEKSTIQVVFIFGAELNDKNRVLNLPESVPTIQITPSRDNSGFKGQMRDIANNILERMKQPIGLCNPDITIPEPSKADFGVVAHEVGTMRMGAVVDENLKVKKWDNLYICDLSVFPVSPSANPSLTLAALAQRLGKHLVEKPKSTKPIKPTSQEND